MKGFIGFARRVLQAVAITYVLVPTFFYSSLKFRQTLIFGAFIIWPFHDYTKPADYGLPFAKNFYVNSVGDIRLGAWYVPPKGAWERLSQQPGGHEPQQWMLDDNRPVIIYYHGHAQCRACDYRVGLYKTLTQSDKLDAHVFTFDYRGFGDSSNVLPDREGVLHDSLVMFDHVRKLVKNDDSRILVWGHSLGTGVAVQLVEAFTELQRSPMGVVLEAPFNSLSEAAFDWPIALPYRFLPVSESLINRLKEDDETFYETEQLAASVNFPVLVIHSPDDALVSFRLGQKLLATLRALSKAPVHFYQADDSYSLGHRYIHKDPKVQDAVAEFIRRYSRVTLPESRSDADAKNGSSIANMLEKVFVHLIPSAEQHEAHLAFGGQSATKENTPPEQHVNEDTQAESEENISKSYEVPEDEL